MRAPPSYVHRVTSFRFKVCVGFCFFLSIFFLILCLPDTSFMRAIGVIDFQHRVKSFKSALYWESRVLINPYVEIDHTVLYGYVNSLGRDGMVEVTLPVEEQFVTRRFALADLKIKDYESLSKFFNERKNYSVKFDIYGDMVVLHSDSLPDTFTPRVPLNIQFIEKGFATADPNPPTNIVDSAFAAHYWNIVRGN